MWAFAHMGGRMIEAGFNLQKRPGEKTRDAIARYAGFGSYRTYKRVAFVVHNGCRELVDALENKAISRACAYEIAKLPIDELRAILAGKTPSELRQIAVRNRKLSARPRLTLDAEASEEIMRVAEVMNMKAEDLVLAAVLQFVLHARRTSE
jgi:hypothetical protein